MPTVKVHETELFYLMSGNGLPCLVMHGGLRFDHTYLRGLNIVSDVLRLVYYDHRHNGHSGRPGAKGSACRAGKSRPCGERRLSCCTRVLQVLAARCSPLTQCVKKALCRLLTIPTGRRACDGDRSSLRSTLLNYTIYYSLYK